MRRPLAVQRYVSLVTCVPVSDSLRGLLTTIGDTEVDADTLDAAALDKAMRWGWVFEYQGRVSLTGAGAWHAGGSQRSGLLGG